MAVLEEQGVSRFIHSLGPAPTGRSHLLFIYSFIYSGPQALPPGFGCRFRAGSPPLLEMKALKDHSNSYISDIQGDLLGVDRIIGTSVQYSTIPQLKSPLNKFSVFSVLQGTASFFSIMMILCFSLQYNWHISVKPAENIFKSFY